jgi:hypothetical protein
MGRPHPPMARCPPPDTQSLRSRHEPSPRHVQICSPAADLEPVGVLRQPTIADFGPSKDPFDHQERRFNLRPDLRLRTIPGPFLLTQRPMAMGFRLHEALGLGRVLTNDGTLPTISDGNERDTGFS